MIGAEATQPGGPPLGLFDTLADRRIAVEINLSSNRTILGVSGPDHPLRDYISFGVPVVISTDDEGVARSDVTNEWVQAVSEHRLAYPDLVRMARNSLEYSFLRGESLWEQAPAGEYRRVSSCRRERLDTKEDALADDCQHLLEENPIRLRLVRYALSSARSQAGRNPACPAASRTDSHRLRAACTVL